MPREVLPPAELHARLTARLARSARRADSAANAATAKRRRGTPKLWSLVLAAVAMLALAVGTLATHGDAFIDLTTADAEVIHQDAVFLQGGTGAGTGNFDPYLTLNPSGSATTESGINVCNEAGCPAAQFDTHMGGGRTHELKVSAVPVIEYEGGLYREFSLDANDSGTDSYMSVDEIRLFTDNQEMLGLFNPATNSFGNDDGASAQLIFDLDTPILVESQTLEPGSGVSDITVLIPNELFPDECYYGSQDCDQWLFFYTVSGEVGTGAQAGRDYDVSAGFEEWRIQLLPVVNVAKTAVPSFDIEYDWTIEKSVDPDELHLFKGDSDSVDWTVDVFRDAGTTSNVNVSGEITILNPTGGDFDIADPIPAVIATVEDVLELTGGDIIVDVDCPATFPYELGAGDTLTCTYSQALATPDDGLNRATVTIGDGQGGTSEYEGTADVDFSTADPNEIDATATVTDDRGPLNESVSDDDSFTYPETFGCNDDEGEHTNTAVVTEDDSGATDEASATVTVNCYELTVTKDADTSLTRDYDWEIAKTRVLAEGEVDGDGDLSTLTLAEGQQYLVTYEITVTMTGFTDADWAVTGTITIDNPAPIDAIGVDVSDVISGGTNATVDCGGGATMVDVPAEDSVDCTYSADLPDGADRTNTATASLFGEDYTGTADVLFDGDTEVTELDECINVWDDNGTPADDSDDTDLGEVCLEDLDGDDQFTFTHTILIGPFECGEHTFTNTARFAAVDTDETGSDSYTIAIDVPCPEGCTLTPGYWKTHNESFWGGAPHDDAWLLIPPAAEDSPFFLSGQSYFDVLWTAPKGNAYYNLAFHYIAAELNMLNGADGSSIQTDFDAATGLFNTYTPAEIGALKGNNALRQQFISLAGTLGAYNEGLIGPGHCDDDGSSTNTAGTGPSVAVQPRRGGLVG